MDGLARSVGSGIGSLFSSAVSAVGSAIDGVSAQIERVIPGGALPLVVAGVIVVFLALWLIRH
jgi:hypothetical protein